MLLYECFHCLTNGVFWLGDFDFDDYGLEGQGIVHVCKCANCGADITYYIRIDDEEGEEDDVV